MTLPVIALADDDVPVPLARAVECPVEFVERVRIMGDEQLQLHARLHNETTWGDYHRRKRHYLLQQAKYAACQAELTRRRETPPPEPAPALPKAPVTGIIYFIRAGDHVKIGFTTDLQTRLSSYRTHSPIPPELIASREGTASDERALHKRFAAYREQREWFRLEGELRAFVEGGCV